MQAQSAFGKIADNTVIEIGRVSTEQLTQTLKNLGEDYKEIPSQGKVGWRLQSGVWLAPEPLTVPDVTLPYEPNKTLTNWVTSELRKPLAPFSEAERLTWQKQIEEAIKALNNESVIFISKQADIASKTLKEQAQSILNAEARLQTHAAIIRGIRTWAEMRIKNKEPVTTEILNNKLAQELELL